MRPGRRKAAKRAEEFSIPKVYRDAETMFAAEAIDALDVASPRQTHAGWVEAAAARGIDVLCQKPMTPTLAESEALVRRVEGKSRLMVHENWRFRPWYRELKRWIVAGELGDVHPCAHGDDHFRDIAGRERPAAVARTPALHAARRAVDDC